MHGVPRCHRRANSSLRSVQRAVAWGLAHDEELQAIAAAGAAYARRLYTLDHLGLYVAAVTRAWARSVAPIDDRNASDLRHAQCGRTWQRTWRSQLRERARSSGVPRREALAEERRHGHPHRHGHGPTRRRAVAAALSVPDAGQQSKLVLP